MLQLIVHLLGDFVLQNDWMAKNKNENTTVGHLACFVHCMFYCMPFYLAFSLSLPQILLVFSTHFVIDKYCLAKKWTSFYKIGSRLDVTNWLHVYLIFMVDMAMHLACNYIII